MYNPSFAAFRPFILFCLGRIFLLTLLVALPLRNRIPSQLPSHIVFALRIRKELVRTSLQRVYRLCFVKSRRGGVLWSAKSDARKWTTRRIAALLEYIYDFACEWKIYRKGTHISLPEDVASDEGDEAGVHERDEGSSRGPAEVAPAVFVQF